MAHPAMSDNQASVKIVGPSTEVRVWVEIEENGYKVLIVAVDGRERVRIRHVHPRILKIEG
jgi:hypothetical protein